MQHMTFEESLGESGYSTPNSRNRRIIREIIVWFFYYIKKKKKTITKMSLVSIPKKLLWSNPKTLVWPPVLYFYCKPMTITIIIMCAIELRTKFILTNINDDIAHFLLLAFLHRLAFWAKLVSLVCLWTILYIFPTHNLAIISQKVRFEPVLQISKLRLNLGQNSTLCTAMSLLIFHNAKRAFNLEKSIYILQI